MTTLEMFIELNKKLYFLPELTPVKDENLPKAEILHFDSRNDSDLIPAWIVRDSDETIRLFIENKPQKGHTDWFNYGNLGWLILDEKYLPDGVNVSWYDDEPLEIKLKLKP